MQPDIHPRDNVVRAANLTGGAAAAIALGSAIVVLVLAATHEPVPWLYLVPFITLACFLAVTWISLHVVIATIRDEARKIRRSNADKIHAELGAMQGKVMSEVAVVRDTFREELGASIADVFQAGELHGAARTRGSVITMRGRGED